MAREKQKATKPRARKPRAVSREPTVMADQPAAFPAVVDGEVPTLGGNSASILLPECMDSSAAEQVKALLLSARGAPTQVDASQVRRVGVQSLQILIAASQTWKRDGHTYAVVNPSSELTGTLTLLGLAGRELSIGEM